MYIGMHYMKLHINLYEDEAKLDELVSRGVDLDTVNKDGKAVLHHLVESSGSVRGIEMLIRKGTNVNARELRTGRTTLHLAVLLEPERVDLVQKLIELGADVHAADKKCVSTYESIPLHLVAQFGSGRIESIDILKLLVKHGGSSDLLILDADGDTPLHCAALNRQPTILKELLKILSRSSVSNVERLESSSAASSVLLLSVINLPNHKGQTPLHYAVGKLSANIKIVRHLLKVGAAVDSCDAEGVTPLHLGVGTCNLEAIPLLLETGAVNTRIRDVYGATPFHYAARSGSVEVLGMLNEKDVDDRATENGLTPLHYAAWNKRKEAVEWLLKHKASVDVIDRLKGDTPLHLAARRGDAEVIQTLIEKGVADTQLLNHKGSLALGLADDRGHHGAAKAFVKAIREQNREDRLLGSLWTSHRGNGATLLHYFAAYGEEEDMEWIFKMIKRKQRSFDRKGNSDRQHREQQYGVDKTDKSNRNAVHWAAMRGNIHALKVLVKNNAKLNANANANDVSRDPCPQTPLYFALMGGKKPFADELMKLKSERPDLHEQDWESPLCLCWVPLQQPGLLCCPLCSSTKHLC